MSDRGKVIRLNRLTRAMLRADRRTVFVFGDNMIGQGYGGQAGQMRGEPNAIGVPTKWAPTTRAGDYFSDDDWDLPDVRHAVFGAFDRIDAALAEGRNVVIPTDGLGTGLAQLPQRAPKIAAYIEKRIATLTGSRPDGLPEPAEQAPPSRVTPGIARKD